MPDLGTAYVQIVPSAEGISGSISKLFDGEASSAGESAGKNIAGTLVKTLSGALAAAGIGKMIGEAISAGADLEQSIGGIETLFGTNGFATVEAYAEAYGKTVEEVADKYSLLEQAQSLSLENANEAYKTAGLSANDYMQTVTSFAAALKSSTADEVEAAKAADAAVIAMADNANKMGTDMGSIQAAYQGFAKQNYTMLDNLKLGYGGTKTEMQRLLADAEKLTGIHYDIDNLADVYSAIQAIQDQLGITGTTAKEAASTYSGSLSMLQSSWQNVLAALTTGVNLEGAMQGLGESLVTYGENAFRMIGNIVQQIPALFSGIATSLGPQLLTWATNIITSVANGIMTGVPQLLTAGQSMIQSISDGVAQNLPQLLSEGVEIITGLIDGVLQGLPQFLAVASEMITGFVSAVMTYVPQVLSAGMEILIHMVTGIMQAMPQIITTAGEIMTNIITTIMTRMPEILAKGVELLGQLCKGIIKNLPAIVTAVAQVVAKLFSAIATHYPDIIKTGFEILGKIIAGILDAIPNLIDALPQVIDAIKKPFGEFDWASIGKSILDGIASGITKAVGSVVEAAKSAGGAIKDGLADLFHIGSPSKVMADEIGRWIPPGIAEGFVQALPGSISMMRNELGAMIPALSAPALSYRPAVQAVDNTDRLLDALRDDRTVNVTVTLQGDAKNLFKAVNTVNERRTRATGYNAFAMG